jgi:hypothetical protein
MHEYGPRQRGPGRVDLQDYLKKGRRRMKSTVYGKKVKM